MSDVIIGWVIEARNDEIPPSEKFKLEQSPREYTWDTDWHIIDAEAFEHCNTKFLVSKAFRRWENMVPASLDECSVKIVKLAKDFVQSYLHNNNSNAVEWRVRNIYTQEIIPGAVYGV